MSRLPVHTHEGGLQRAHPFTGRTRTASANQPGSTFFSRKQHEERGWAFDLQPTSANGKKRFPFPRGEPASGATKADRRVVLFTLGECVSPTPPSPSRSRRRKGRSCRRVNHNREPPSPPFRPIPPVGLTPMRGRAMGDMHETESPL